MNRETREIVAPACGDRSENISRILWDRVLSAYKEAIGARIKPLKGDRFNSLRRHLAMLGDQAFVLLRYRLLPSPVVEPFDGNPRFVLITVNSSTTRFLRLMLLTLSEQWALSLVLRLIVLDNDSGDGGLPFIHRLASCIPRVHLLENRRFPTHARGIAVGGRLARRPGGRYPPAPARQSAPVL